MPVTNNVLPGALAGATGAGYFERAFTCKEFLRRAEAATVLCRAIADCDRDDAVVILSAALADLSMGSPLPVFSSAMDDARWWASFAAPHEIKAYLLACFEVMRPEDRAAFLGYVQRGAT
jgi:hypothetical protein